VNVVDRYATDVVEGRLPAGKYHRLPCQRHLNDLERSRLNDPEFPYRFDIAQAERFFRFAEKLRHYKGEWAGQTIALSDFQKFRLGCVFGWRHTETGFRRFTTAYNELPRKQGKSLEAAVQSLYVTFFEGEPGAEGYCIATKEKQAADIVFRDIKLLIASSGLKTRLKVQVKNIHHEGSSSKLEPLGSDSETLDGLNPQSITTDELHGFKRRGLLDVMESATGARRNPMHYQITTAGDDPVSVCGDQHDYACKILDGIFADFATERFFACIAHADLEDDWLEESTWRKANPHYGISVKPDDIRTLALKAKNMPSAAAEFKQKRLNLWVNADAPWLSMDGWKQGQTSWEEADLAGEPCWVGIDLASKIDLLAMAALFPPTEARPLWRIVRRVWTPEDTLINRARRDRAPYEAWVAAGYLKTTPGRKIDHRVVRTQLKAWRSQYALQVVGFDPWHADKLIDDLITEDGFDQNVVVEVPQTYAGMSSACLVFEADVLEGVVDANGCPLMRWAASNAVVQRDGKDNIYPVKKKSRGRIDPIMATLIARALYLKQPLTPVAEDPELVVV
jgi:phage terminase large subunit-like protein